MRQRFTAAQAAAAEADANRRGLPHLAKMFHGMYVSLSSAKPIRTSGARRPRVCLTFNNRAWCDGRLSAELARQLSWDYDCRLVDNTDQKFFTYQDDIYLMRSVTRLSIAPPPPWARNRIICMLESERPLIQTEYLRRYNHASVIVAQNTKLRDMAREKGLDHVLNLTIGNGINTEEFTPARDYPEEFTVGASGNFSLEAFDEWKGFGRYIVPACKLAKVKLRWCSWKGQAFSMPKTVGEQVPLNMMNKWYHGLSCLVSMSKSEGCSGVVFEAMASGLPVISTKVGWHGDKCTDQILWAERPQEQTPYTDKVTIEELTHRILWLKNHPAAARAVGARARKFSEGWPHSRVADQWRRVFSTLRV